MQNGRLFCDFTAGGCNSVRSGSLSLLQDLAAHPNDYVHSPFDAVVYHKCSSDNPSSVFVTRAFWTER